MSSSSIQSPILLQPRSVIHRDDYPALEFVGHDESVGGAAELLNTGTSAQINLPNRHRKPFIQGGPLNGKFIFEQIHFHWADNDNCGCEHLLNGETYSMEAHLVHYNSKYKNFADAVDKPDGLAVTGFFIQASGKTDCPEFKKITDGIERIQKPQSTTRLGADCLTFLQNQELRKHYFTYKGSLTTPPFYESVTWIVYRTPIYVSEHQVAVFRTLLGSDGKKCIVNNYRDVQQPKIVPEISFCRNCKLKSKL